MTNMSQYPNDDTAKVKEGWRLKAKQDMNRIDFLLNSENSNSQNDIEVLVTEIRDKYSEWSDKFDRIWVDESYSGEFGNKNSLKRYKPLLELISEGLNIVPVSNENSSSQDTNVYVKNENSNTNKTHVQNTIQIDIDAEFHAAIDTVNKMTALGIDQINETVKKIEEIKEIINSNGIIQEKWGKAKSVLNWLSQKGPDIAKTIMPLLMHIVTNG